MLFYAFFSAALLTLQYNLFSILIYELSTLEIKSEFLIILMCLTGLLLLQHHVYLYCPSTSYWTMKFLSLGETFLRIVHPLVVAILNLILFERFIALALVRVFGQRSYTWTTFQRMYLFVILLSFCWMGYFR